MAVYLFILGLLSFLTYKYDICGYVKNRSQWELFALTFMICVVGFRYHIGSDTIVYEWNFNTSATPYLADFFKHWREYTQPLWILLMSFCKTVFNDFVYVQFFQAIIYHVLIFRFIKKTTKYTFFALLMVFCLVWFSNSFEVLREAISAALFLNAILLLKEKKYIEYILIAIIATGFHSFALFVFALTSLVVICNYKILLVFYVLCFLFAKVVDRTLVNDFLYALSTYLSENTSEKMSLYIGQKDTTIVSLLGILRGLLLSFFLPIAVLYYTDEEQIFYKKLVILWMIFSSMKSQVPILYRMNNYFLIVYIVLLVNVILSLKQKQCKKHYYQILLFLTICSCFLGLRDVYRPGPIERRSNINYDCRYFPYKTIFQEPDPVREGLDYYH